MSILNEFKAFAMRGNVMDLAVGIIIGGAFGKIVSSLVADVIMPPIGVLMGGVDFTNLAITLKAADTFAGTEAVVLKYGMFVQTVVDFTIVAFAIFMMIKLMNKMKKEQAEAPSSEMPALTKDQQLLEEIRDLLSKKK
ncbi:MAG: large-conductance mechanosensitive channel protein MscL [Alphaproteobacteria bacterium]